MATHTLTPTRYTLILVVLVLLTFLTLGISLAPLTGGWHIAVGLLIGTCKATLVVLFFMHALNSPRLTWVVIAVACFWLGILFVLTLTDYFTRGMIPHVPGH